MHERPENVAVFIPRCQDASCPISKSESKNFRILSATNKQTNKQTNDRYYYIDVHWDDTKSVPYATIYRIRLFLETSA